MSSEPPLSTIAPGSRGFMSLGSEAAAPVFCPVAVAGDVAAGCGAGLAAGAGAVYAAGLVPVRRYS